MVDRALQLLTLHIMWKARSLPASPELSPEEMQLRDKLKEERESLLEKLVEFAVGTQSNTVEGVRRAVCGSALLPDWINIDIAIWTYRPSKVF